MNRRTIMTLLGGAAAWPLAARAQQGERMKRIGVLLSTTEDREIRLAAFQQALERLVGRFSQNEGVEVLEGAQNLGDRFRKAPFHFERSSLLGWWEGRNVRIDYRLAPAPNADQAQMLAKELVVLQPDVVLAQGTPITAAFQRESTSVPIVFFFVNDPIGSGFIASLARPGGNLTGLTLLEATIAGKWLAMLKEIAPRVTRAALVINPQTSSFAHYSKDAKAMAGSLAIELVPAPVENVADIERVIESIAREPNGGLVLPPDATTILHHDLIIALAARYHVPAVYAFRLFVSAGGLISYGVDYVDQFRQVASYVDRILRGASPADLPVQAPTKYETVLNLKTAKALGLTVPPGLLVAADEVIE